MLHLYGQFFSLAFAIVFPRSSMKRILLSLISAAASLSMITPAFAYITGEGGLEAQTSIYHSGRPAKRLIMSRFGETDNKLSVSGRATDTRMEATTDVTGRVLLQRADGRRFRRLNRMPKEGTDRYRTLNIHMNRRAIREDMMKEESSSLPSVLVQTGDDNHDNPSRRTIRNDRDSNILLEISNSSQND